MKITRKHIERITITGTNAQRARAFEYLTQHRFRTTYSGPARGRKTTYSETRFEIIAEREVANNVIGPHSNL